MKKVDAQTLEHFAQPVLARLGYELVDLEWKPEGGGWVLRLFIDFPGAADGDASASLGAAPTAPAAAVTPSEHGASARRISHEDCALASRVLGGELDAADLIPQAFSLELSSPGLDRPLKREADFRRFAGQRAKVRTRVALAGTQNEQNPGGRRNFAGVLRGASDGRLRIDVDGHVYEIPVDEVDKAHLIPEL